MPQINVTGAYAYMAKDIGFDFNEMKGPAKDLAGKILGSGIITDPAIIQGIQGLLNPMMNADWFLKVQDRSLGFVGGEVTVPIWMGGKINAANRAARINEKTAVEQGNQTRNALISDWPSPRRSSRCASRWSTACASTSKTPGRSNATA